MSTDLTEFQDSARKVLSALDVPADEDKTWQLIIDLGWLLVPVPEEMDGLGQGLAAACAFYTEIGRSLAGAPYLPAMLAVDAVCQSGLADRESWVERLTAGELVCVPLVESTLSAVSASDGKVRLSGLASAVQSADKASHIIVCTSSGEHVSLVPFAQDGVGITPRPTWDTTRRLFDVQFTDVALDETLILATGQAAQKLSERLSTHRDFALAADAVGGADALLDMTVEYLQTRRQFGRPLAMFQALKHRCADMKASTVAAEALLLDCLDRLEGEDAASEAEHLGKMAKTLACSAYARVAEESVQLHGGIAMTSEHPCHLFLKRSLLNEHLGQGKDDDELGIANTLLAKL